MDSDNTMTDVTFDAQAILASIVSSRGRARERLIDIDQVEDAIKSHTRALELAARLAKEVEGEGLPQSIDYPDLFQVAFPSLDSSGLHHGVPGTGWSAL